MEAKGKDFDEALLLDYQNNVAEGPGENIFIVKDKKLFTPPLGNILPGITRDSIIKIARNLGYGVNEKTLSLDEVYNADEAMFCGTAAEITPISIVDKHLIGKKAPGPITKKLKETFLEIVHGRNKDYEDWLTYINE
jgi:branched-chain amino acid aminotransferase